MIGAWDVNSVMNYCNPNWVGNGQLSATDIAGVVQLYGAPGTGRLVANQSLTLGQGLSSPGGQFSLVLQGDGNLVHYWNGQGGLWTANTWGTGAQTAYMQPDGNFVVYSTPSPTVGAAVWSSNTYGHPGAYLVVQRNGNVAIYDPDGTMLWQTGTNYFGD